MRVKNIPNFIALLLIFVYSLNVSATEALSELIIHQTSIEERKLFSFISIYDSSGNLFEDVTQGSFEVNYGNERGEIIDLRDFSSQQFGTGYVFMVDISKSVTEKNFNRIKESILVWIDALNPGDAASLITFGEEVNVLTGFSYDRVLLKDIVIGIERTDMETRLNDGLIAAHELSSVPDIKFPSRRAVICLTDGINEFSGEGANSQDVIGVLTSQRLPIYTIGFAEDSNQEKLEGIKVMSNFSEQSGGIFLDANALSIEGAYRKAKELIDSTYMLITNCNSCDYAGDVVNLSLSYSLNGQTLTSVAPLKLISSDRAYDPFKKILEEKTFFKTYYFEILGFIFLILVLAGMALVIYFRNTKNLSVFNLNDNSILENEEFEVTGNSIENFNFELKNPSIAFELIAIASKSKEKFSGVLNKNCSIGRSSSCDLIIDNQPEISAQHCRLELSKRNLFIVDNDSTNKTYVNGVSINNRFLLKNGDTLGLGRAEYRIVFKEEDL